MNFKSIIFNSLKIGLTISIGFFFLDYLFSHINFYTVSPDSIRFMHFWQINFDHLKSLGFSLINILKFIYYSLKSSTIYDINRGRYFQYIIYGVDGLSRSRMPNALINYIMILLISINSLLISKLVTNKIKSINTRINFFCLAFLFIITLCYSISPIILLNLYGKYLWATFILCYFSTSKKLFKIIFLIACALSDELGFLASIIIIYLIILKKALSFYETYFPDYTADKILKNSISISFCLCALIFFAFYGFSSTLFNVGSGFASLAFGFAGEAINGGISNAIFGLGWLSENLIIGVATNNNFFGVITCLIVFIIISINIYNLFHMRLKLKEKRLSLIIVELLNDSESFFNIVWISLFLVINLIIIPGGVGDFTHRSYPRFLTLTLLLLYSVINFRDKRLIYIFFMATISMHILNIDKNIRLTVNGITSYLLPDGSVKVAELNSLRGAILDINSTFNYESFNAINNSEEIDFSGTWYFSKRKNFDNSFNSYFPIEGTTRVLIWPRVIAKKKSKRVFMYEKPIFIDNR